MASMKAELRKLEARRHAADILGGDTSGFAKIQRFSKAPMDRYAR